MLCRDLQTLPWTPAWGWRRREARAGAPASSQHYNPSSHHRAEPPGPARIRGPGLALGRGRGRGQGRGGAGRRVRGEILTGRAWGRGGAGIGAGLRSGAGRSLGRGGAVFVGVARAALGAGPRWRTPSVRLAKRVCPPTSASAWLARPERVVDVGRSSGGRPSPALVLGAGAGCGECLRPPGSGLGDPTQGEGLCGFPLPACPRLLFCRYEAGAQGEQALRCRQPLPSAHPSCRREAGSPGSASGRRGDPALLRLGLCPAYRPVCTRPWNSASLTLVPEILSQRNSRRETCTQCMLPARLFIVLGGRKEHKCRKRDGRRD